MRLKTLIILIIALLVLILVPANGTLLNWLGLNGSSFAGESLPEDSTDTRRATPGDSEPDTGSYGSRTKPSCDCSRPMEDTPEIVVLRTAGHRGTLSDIGDAYVIDKSLEPLSGAWNCHGDSKAVRLDPALSGMNEQDGLAKLRLEQNHPNPFNSTTTISFSIPFGGEASLEVLNILGQRVSEVFRGHLEEGIFEITVDESIKDLASGIYFYRLRHENQSLVRKMLLLR